MRNIIPVAYQTLYNEEIPYTYEIAYSGRFKGFNANVRLQRNHLTFSLSRRWNTVSTEIKLGLIQELLVKITKRKAHTVNMDLYNYFLKSVDKTVPITHTDPILKQVFDKINAQFFYGLMDQPNLVWGQDSTSTLGHYNFGEDKISISKIFRPENCDDPALLEFVMYHEMLHKHHKFESSHGRTSSHTPAFRADEAKFPDKVQVEKRMNLHAAKHRRRSNKRSWWF